MDSKSLDVSQVRRLNLSISRMTGYLESLTGRMHQKHFPHTDPLKTAGDDALRAMLRLRQVVNEIRESSRTS